MAVTSDLLYITYVDAHNGLLKIWGQPNRTCATYIEKQLLQLVPEFNRSVGPSPSQIRKGMFCFAKYEDDSYYRARVISDVLNNAVLVFFIDYGNKDCVDLSNIRILNSPAESIVTTIVAQAEEYYLANIRAEGGWSQEVMNEIRRGLCYSEFKYRTVCQCGNERLIQISYRNEDYSSFLIRQELAKPVSVIEQMILLRNSFKNPSMEPMGNTFRGPNVNQHAPQPANRDNFFVQNKVQLRPTTQEHVNQPVQVNPQPVLPQPVFTQPQNRSGIVNSDRHFNVMNPPQKVVFNQSSNNPPVYPEAKSTPVINTVVIEALANQLKQHLMKDQLTSIPGTSTQGYVTQVLDVKTTHNVYISYIDDGPWSFSVQLVSNEHELNQLMDDLASYNFQPIRLPLVLGSPCIAKSRQYDNYCRGVLVNITHSAVKVFFVDFGNTEDLPFNMLFEMPAKFFKVKTMSQKFALSGLQRVRPTEDIKNAFIEVVENELLILHVTNLEGENLPTCDLYLKDINIKRILNEKLRQVKNWDPIHFPRPGEIENVLVTWVESAQKFYVQLKRCDAQLKDLKMELAKLGANGENFDPEEISPGTICICFFTGDNNWYRAVVTSVNSTKTVTVFYVDYGNTEVVDSKMVKKVGNGLITKIKTLAIPCCFAGYENESPNSSIKAALTELILEKEFSLKVVSDEKDRIIVQLFDNGKDMSLCLKNVTFNLQEKPSVSDTIDKTEKFVVESDLINKKSNGKGTYNFSGKNGSDRMDSGKSRGKKDLRNEKVKSDFLTWRSDDRKDVGPKAKDDNKNTKVRDVKEPLSEMKNEKHNGSKVGRYSFKAKKSENVKLNDRDQKNWEKNWRGTESFGGKTFGGDSRNKTKLGESISERMKRAARENEARGLKLSESIITKLPVKLENIAFHGHIFAKKDIEIGSTEDVIVTYFVNPNEIYVQLLSSKENFRDFMVEIHNYYSTKLPLLNKPKKGDVVVAKFQQDGVLYRAVVIETEPITVRYVDFGNEEISEKEHLWPMDKKFLSLESQCLKCTLPNLKPVGSDTWPAPNPEMDNIFEYETYSCTFLKKLDDGYEVKLIISGTGVDVRDELISSGFAYAVDKTMESRPPKIKSTNFAFDLMCNEIFNVFITHIVDATEFYVQIRCKEQEAIEEEIRKFVLKEEFGSLVDSNNLKYEDLCLVKVVRGNWHRAKIIEKREIDTTTVRLIDYGNELSVGYEQIWPLPDGLVKYPPQAIQCSLSIDADALNAELTEEFSEYNKKNYTAIFHEISCQSLKVTLYSSIGEKIEFPGCYNNAPAWIRPIADLPIINRHMEVITSHINSPKDIYVQLLNDAKDIKELSSIIMNFYSGEEDFEMEENLSEYEMYAAKSVSDNSWYRAQLLCHNGKSAKMFYIDFGNSEEVPKQNLRKLDSSFYGRYAYAKRVSLNIAYDDDSERDINDKLRQLIGGKACTGYFVKVNDIIYAEFMVDDRRVTPQLVSGSVKELRVGLFKDYIPKRSEEGPKVYVSHVSHPREFWVHEESISCELSTFQDKLQAACSDGVSKEDIEVGDIVGTLFKDKLWYRALVTSVKDNIISIRFLDYGNTFDIDKTENGFILLNEELKKLPPFARKCSLKGFWKKNATSRFEDIVLNNEDTFTLIQIGDGSDKVDLLQNGSSVTEQLIKEGYGKRESDNVFITHINSPDDFYIQKENDQDLLDMVINEMSQGNLLEDAADVRLNELYCARYPVDDLWYRAKVLTKDENDVIVSFIDYGNCSSVTEIKELPPDLKTLRPLATNCSLVNEKPEDTWSEAECNFFWKFISNVPLKMKVVEQGSQINIIRLFTEDGEDLNETLLRLSESFDTAPEPMLIDNEIICVENEASLLCQENIVYGDCADSCPSEIGESDVISAENTFKSSNSLDKTPNFSKCCTEKIVPGRVSLGERSFKDYDNSECIKKLSHSEKIVPGCVTRRLSLEEVSVRNIDMEEKPTHNSFSAPVTPSVPRRRQKRYKKIEREDKPLPGCIFSGSFIAVAQDKITHDEKQVAANVNGTMKDVRN